MRTKQLSGEKDPEGVRDNLHKLQHKSLQTMEWNPFEKQEQTQKGLDSSGK
jgi:hypothetical protein